MPHVQYFVTDLNGVTEKN